jgi:hypothetical protein
VSGNTTALNIRAWSGELEIRNLEAGDIASVDLVAGQLVLGATNTGGTLSARGISIPITDNTAGTTIDTTGLLPEAVAEAVLDVPADDHNIPGTIGEAINSGGEGGGGGTCSVGACKVVTAYLKSDYCAGRTGNQYVKGTTITTVTGAWKQALMLDPAAYTLVFYKQKKYGPDTYDIVVNC